MNEITMNISIPLDDDGFFRRECPFCQREFKILLEKKELKQITQMGIDSFMVESEEEIDLEDSNFFSSDIIWFLLSLSLLVIISNRSINLSY